MFRAWVNDYIQWVSLALWSIIINRLTFLASFSRRRSRLDDSYQEHYDKQSERAVCEHDAAINLLEGRTREVKPFARFLVLGLFNALAITPAEDPYPGPQTCNHPCPYLSRIVLQ